MDSKLLYNNYIQELKKVYRYFDKLGLKDLERWLIVKKQGSEYYLTKLG